MKKSQHLLRYGFYSFLGIVSFFLLMKLFGMEDVAELRLFNILIVLYFSNRLARRNVHEQEHNDYLGGLASLFVANVFTVVLVSLSFMLYVKVVDHEFLQHFESGILWAKNITLFQAMIALFLEGIAGSIIVSFGIMQYWKNVKSKKTET